MQTHCRIGEGGSPASHVIVPGKGAGYLLQGTIWHGYGCALEAWAHLFIM